MHKLFKPALVLLCAAAFFACDDDDDSSSSGGVVGGSGGVVGGSGGSIVTGGEGGTPTAGHGGTPVAGEPIAGEPIAGTPVAGEPVGGEPVGGTPIAGEPVGGEPVGGTPIAGEPVGGEPVGGTPIAGEPVGGEPVGGTPVGGEPVGGTPVGGEPVGGEPVGGEGGGGEGGGEPVGNPCLDRELGVEFSDCPATLYEARNPERIPSQTVVTLQGVVTAIRNNASGEPVNIALQVPTDDPIYEGDDYSAIWIYLGDRETFIPAFARGDRIQITAVTNDRFEQRQLIVAKDFEVLAAGEGEPEALVVDADEIATGGARAEALEGVLVAVEAATVTELEPALGAGDRAPSNEFVLDGAVRVNDFFVSLFPKVVVGSQLARVQGILRLANENMKIEPRAETDVVRGVARIADFGPADVEARVGVTGVLLAGGVTPLTVHLDRYAPAGGVTLQVECDNPTALAVAPTLVIQEGSFENTVVAEGLVAAQNVGLTLRLGTQIFHATVDVLDAVAGPSQVDITGPATVALGAVFEITVAIDRPAPPQGVVVNLALDPAEAVTGGANRLAFGEGQQSQTMMFTAGQTAGRLTITTTIADTDITDTLTVDLVEPTSGFVINEVDYDQTDADTAEFVELFNNTDEEIDLSLFKLELVNGSNNTVYSTTILGDVGATLAPGEYLVAAIAGQTGATDNIPEGVAVVNLVFPNGTTPGIQNGAPDGLRLIEIATGLPVDGVSYEGDMAGTGEGVGLPSESSDNGADLTKSIGRCPNGTDTDTNSVDFSLQVPTPGAANTCN